MEEQREKEKYVLQQEEDESKLSNGADCSIGDDTLIPPSDLQSVSLKTHTRTQMHTEKAVSCMSECVGLPFPKKD